MIRSKTLVSCLALAPILFLAIASEPAAQDPDQVLTEQLTAAAGRSVQDLWAQAVGLRRLAQGSAAEALDRALDARLANHAELTPEARLLAASARLQGADPDPAAVEPALRSLLGASSPEIARQAVALLGGPTFRRLMAEPKSALLVELGAIAGDATREPELRIAAAQSSFALGGYEARVEARKLMVSFAHSGDPGLARLGSLALAAAGDDVAGVLQESLEQAALAPGDAGRLAAAYLKVEQLRRLQERKLAELEQTYQSAIERERLPAELQKLPELMEHKDELARIGTIMDLIAEQHVFGQKFDQEDLLDAALDGMLHALDEHSTYLEPSLFEEFAQDLEAEYGGIGAYVDVDPDDEIFTITRPIYSGPAYKAGIATDDKIVRIDGWPTLQQPIDEIIRRLKGKPGTRVRLYVWRRGMDPGLIERPTEDMAVEVVRAQIAIPPVAWQLLPGDIALVELRTFSRVASAILRQQLQELSARGVKGFVFDLRRNQGGLLDEAVDVAQLFLPRGSLVVTTDFRTEPTVRYQTSEAPALAADVPIAILTSRFTASAAEIVSGALQDHGRAELVGERTFGKGSIQNLIPVPGAPDEEFTDENGNRRFDNWEEYEDANGNQKFDYGPRVKLTTGRYLLPSGRSIHHEIDRDKNEISPGGIAPDREIRFPRVEYWKLEEQIRIVRRERDTREYVAAHWAEHKERFRELAEFDALDETRYPDFDGFYAGLKTPLSRADVRELVRDEVRRRVQDERGAEFPLGDFQEDVQLQEAIRVVFSKLGRSPSEVPEYAVALGNVEQESSAVHGDLLAASGAAGPERERARREAAELLRGARDGKHVLSRDELGRILDLIAEPK